MKSRGTAGFGGAKRSGALLEGRWECAELELRLFGLTLQKRFHEG